MQFSVNQPNLFHYRCGFSVRHCTYCCRGANIRATSMSS